jgi:D-alanine-D-alanine ligase-like ATP-grasp enzyme
LQELLEKEKIPFVGSGSISSRIAIKKDLISLLLNAR